MNIGKSFKKTLQKIKEKNERNTVNKAIKQKKKFDAVKESIRSSDTTEFFDLIASGKIDVHQEDDILLKYAAYIGNIEVVKYLIRDGSTISSQDQEAIEGAIKNNHLEMVKLLLKHGAEINTHILNFAAKNANIEIFKYLYTKSKSKMVNTIINVAIEEDKKDIIDYLENMMSKKSNYAYKWENLYDNKNLSKYRILEAGKVYKIAKNKPIHEIKKELYKKIYARTLPNDCINKESISGDSIEDIPLEYLYSFTQDGKTYCEDLRAMTKVNKNPYTGKSLDNRVANDILEKSKLLN